MSYSYPLPTNDPNVQVNVWWEADTGYCWVVEDHGQQVGPVSGIHSVPDLLEQIAGYLNPAEFAKDDYAFLLHNLPTMTQLEDESRRYSSLTRGLLAS